MSWRTEGLSIFKNLIVVPWNDAVESYVALGEKVEYVRPAFCPNCDHSRLIFWGKRARFAANGAGSHLVFVRRVRCKGCNKTHTVLPAFLLKNRAYVVDAILEALIVVFVDGGGSRAAAEKLGLARTTIRRWTDRFKVSAARHYRRFLFLKHNLKPDASSRPPSDYPKAALGLFAELFGIEEGGFEVFGRRMSLATAGCLLVYQPKTAP